MSDDPARLDALDDVPDLAREALGLARADGPSAARLAALESAVAARVAGGGGGGGGEASPTPDASPGAAATTPGALKVVAAAAVAGAVVVVGVAVTRAPDASTPVPRAPTTASVVPTAEQAPSGAPDVPTLHVDDLPSRPAAVTPARPPPRPSASAEVDHDAAERAEVALLDAAQAALARDAAEALRLCEQHRREHPAGTLAQERDVLAIDALLRLGRRDEAEERASGFRARHPGSGHTRRIDALLAR